VLKTRKVKRLKSTQNTVSNKLQISKHENNTFCFSNEHMKPLNAVRWCFCFRITKDFMILGNVRNYTIKNISTQIFSTTPFMEEWC